MISFAKTVVKVANVENMEKKQKPTMKLKDVRTALKENIQKWKVLPLLMSARDVPQVAGVQV